MVDNILQIIRLASSSWWNDELTLNQCLREEKEWFKFYKAGTKLYIYQYDRWQMIRIIDRSEVRKEAHTGIY